MKSADGSEAQDGNSKNIQRRRKALAKSGSLMEVKFVAVKASRFNSLQHLKNGLILNLKELRRGAPGRPPGPEPESKAY
jgi:hypothetical protein